MTGDVCPNCSTPVTGPYCAQCGQRHGPIRASLRRILADALEDQFSVNATLPRTLKALLIYPGELTREYLNQRIARYIPPVRLYLSRSLIFFLLVSFVTGAGRVFSGTGGDTAAGDSIRAAVADSIMAEVLPRVDSALVRAAVPRDPDPNPDPDRDAGRGGVQINIANDGRDNIDINLGNERLNRYFEARLEALVAMPPDQMKREVIDGFIENAPKVIFILLPIFALLLKIFYFRRFYVEHFIFALHLHAFTFTVFTIILLLPDWIPFVTGLLLLWIPIYALVAMKRVYGQGMFLTLVKWWTLGCAYMALLGFGIVGALLAAVATL